jgi:hypothetical protein
MKLTDVDLSEVNDRKLRMGNIYVDFEVDLLQ